MTHEEHPWMKYVFVQLDGFSLWMSMTHVNDETMTSIIYSIKSILNNFKISQISKVHTFIQRGH
jgi:hypothetical protein